MNSVWEIVANSVWSSSQIFVIKFK
jgi:hypothetical protein